MVDKAVDPKEKVWALSDKHDFRHKLWFCIETITHSEYTGTAYSILIGRWKVTIGW